MKDVFYTLLVVWIIWKIINSVNTIRAKQNVSDHQGPRPRKPGETTVDYIPPKNKSKYDDKGEYVDYEEIE
jgi:hypothetical protein